MSKFSVKEKFGQLSSFVASVFGGAKAKIQQTVNKKPVIKTAAEILRTNGTEATPPSVLPDESVTATPAMTTETSSEETFAQSSMLEVVEVAPTPPTVIEEERVIPPTAPETVVEITQTEVVIAREETSEMASAPEVSSPNSVTSELLAAEAAEKSDLTVEEVKPVGEALPEQIPFNKPVEE
jgi:hypothetical protein